MKEIEKEKVRRGKRRLVPVFGAHRTAGLKIGPAYAVLKKRAKPESENPSFLWREPRDAAGARPIGLRRKWESWLNMRYALNAPVSIAMFARVRNALARRQAHPRMSVVLRARRNNCLRVNWHDANYDTVMGHRKHNLSSDRDTPFIAP